MLGKIRLSDALIAFTTKRTSENNVNGLTHLWVIQELAIAVENKKLIVEVREKEVNQQDGITGQYQRIEYGEFARDKCLVKIVEALGVWHKSSTVRIQLLPPELARNDLRPLLNQGLLTCHYVIKRGNFEYPPVVADIKRITGGLFIDVFQPDRNALIQVNIKHNTRMWSSDYVSLDSYGITLE